MIIVFVCFNQAFRLLTNALVNIELLEGAVASDTRLPDIPSLQELQTEINDVTSRLKRLMCAADNHEDLAVFYHRQRAQLRKCNADMSTTWKLKKFAPAIIYHVLSLLSDDTMFRYC